MSIPVQMALQERIAYLVLETRLVCPAIKSFTVTTLHLLFDHLSWLTSLMSLHQENSSMATSSSFHDKNPSRSTLSNLLFTHTNRASTCRSRILIQYLSTPRSCWTMTVFQITVAKSKGLDRRFSSDALQGRFSRSVAV